MTWGEAARRLWWHWSRYWATVLLLTVDQWRNPA